MPSLRPASNNNLGCRSLLGCSLVLTLALGLGCYGGHNSGDRAGTVNWTLTIQPTAPVLVAGQSLQFTAQTPWGNAAIWSVLPATAGTISPDGLFTAAAPGLCTVYAAWSKDVRYTGSTGVTVLPAPAPADISPNLVQASGAQQTAAGGIANAAVVGEPVPAIQAITANQASKVRHGFQPPSN